MSRLGWLFVAVFASGVAVSLALSASPASSQGGSAPVAAPSCAAATGGVQVVFAVDMSESLAKDAHGIGVVVRGEQLDAWSARLLAWSEQQIDVRVYLAGYGSRWVTLLDWLKFDSDTRSSFTKAVASLTAGDYDTDHALALLGAQQALSDEATRVESEGGVPCPMLVWFTDGALSFSVNSQEFRSANGIPPHPPYSDLVVNDQNHPALVKAAVDVMCRDGGLIEQLRDAGTRFRAVALDNGADFSLVSELVEGQGIWAGPNGSTCDVPPCPEALCSLVELTPTTTSTTSTTTAKPPPEDPCERPDRPCRQEQSVSVPSFTDTAQFVIEAPSGLAGVDFVTSDGTTLVSPTIDSTVELDAGSWLVSVARLDRFRVLATVSAPPDLAGPWTIGASSLAVDPVVSVEAKYLSSITAKVVGDPQIPINQSADIPVELRDAGGQLVSDERIDLDVSAASGDSLSATRNGSGKFNIVVPPSLSNTDDSTVDLTLTPSAGSDGQSFDSTSVSLPIRRPGFPLVTFKTDRDGVVRPGVFDTPGSVSIPYKVLGPLTGSGCATGIEDPLVVSGREIGEIFHQPDSSICVGAGSTDNGVLVVDVSERSQFRSCFNVHFSLRSNDTPEIRVQEQRVCVRVERGPTWWVYLVAATVVLALGLLPLVILAFVNRRAADLADPRLLVVTPNVKWRGGLAEVNLGALVDPNDANRPALSGTRVVDLGEGGRFESRAMVKPGNRGRGRLSLLMLLSGPRVYLMPQSMAGEVLAGRARELKHNGPLDTPIDLGTGLSDVWVVNETRLTAFYAGRAAHDLADDIAEVSRTYPIEPDDGDGFADRL